MQCEGGDCYSSSRFHTALLLMARSFQISLIFDEVQTGFHLGREFFWHRQFNLRDGQGKPLIPNFIVCAKKAQVGLVISSEKLDRTPIEKREEFQVASVIRGYLHAVALDQAQAQIIELEKQSLKRLSKLVAKYSEHLSNPRGLGISFAVDLIDKSKLNSFINLRFEHGLLYYPAGDQTLRFRLNTSFTSADLDFLFQGLDAICSEIFLDKKVPALTFVETSERATGKVYDWHERLIKAKLDSLSGKHLNFDEILRELAELFKQDHSSELVVIDHNNFDNFRERIVRMQQRNYEPARQTKIEKFQDAANNENSLCLGLVKGSELLSMVFASPLSINASERGVRRDPLFGDPKALYMLDVTVDRDLQGSGLGRQMKYALTLLAQAKGALRVHGRNRDRLAASMLAINLSLGAHELFYIQEDYPDNEPHRDVFYYGSDLSWKNLPLSLSDATQTPIRERSLSHSYIHEQLPYLINKICLSNFVSLRFLDQVKGIFDLLPPALRHGYVCSGQSECVDKVAKTIWHQGSKKSSKMLTFNGHYFGNGSFLARSLSDKDSRFFPVDHLAGPHEMAPEQLLQEVEAKLKNNIYLGVWIEPVPQHLLSPVPKSFLEGLKQLCEKYQVPLIYNETASTRYGHNPQHFFASEDESIRPHAGICYLGGQAGIVFTNEQHFLAKPLMLISTWDGDEFAFANFFKAANKIQAEHSRYLETIERFEAKIREYLHQYPVTELHLHQGRGWFSGNIPKSGQALFIKEGDRFLVNPSFDAMEDFINSKG
jgi:4-aminobutyrate aminotransferase-like enzyme